MTEPQPVRISPAAVPPPANTPSGGDATMLHVWSGYHTGADGAGRSWISALRRYFAVMALGNLVWEVAQMPLYTIWQTGTPGQLAYAALHCTAGDILIGLSTLLVALAVLGPTRWPSEARFAVLSTTVPLGLIYTIFSEWLNIDVRHAWAYGARMPVIPILHTGLSPVLQWLVLPVAASVWAWRRGISGPSALGTAHAE